MNSYHRFSPLELKHQYYEEKKAHREELNEMEIQLKTLRDQVYPSDQSSHRL